MAENNPNTLRDAEIRADEARTAINAIFAKVRPEAVPETPGQNQLDFQAWRADLKSEFEAVLEDRLSRKAVELETRFAFQSDQISAIHQRCDAAERGLQMLISIVEKLIDRSSRESPHTSGTPQLDVDQDLSFAARLERELREQRNGKQIEARPWREPEG